MSKIDDGGYAFPIPLTEGESWNTEKFGHPNGMTLRDYFAAAALQGAFLKICDFSYEWCNEITGEKQYLYSEFDLPISESIKGWKLYQTPMRRVSLLCYKYADAMITARKETQP